MLGSFQLHQDYHQADLIDHFEMRTSNENIKGFRSYQFEVFVLVPELADLGFVTETLISKTWNISHLIGYITSNGSVQCTPFLKIVEGSSRNRKP